MGGTVAEVNSPAPPRLPLAARWRPQRFSDVVGQRAPVAVLRAGVQSPDPPRQILLAGGSGLGKTTLGRIYAAALCCEDPPGDGDSCGVCGSCELIWSGGGGTHPDVIEIDAASAGGKDEIVKLASSARVAPVRGRWRVWIIDEAHGVSKAGVDAFLKLLEEPPPGVVFVLATTEIDKMPATLRGRCLELRLAAPHSSELAENISRVADGEGWSLGDGVAELIVEATDTELGVRGTLSTLGALEGTLAQGGTLDADTAATVLGVVPTAAVNKVLDHVADGDVVAALAALNTVVQDHSEPAARRRLLAAAVARLHAAGSDEVADAARTAALVADATPAMTGLSVAVARAAAPDPSDPSDADAITARLTAATERAAQILEQVHAATGTQTQAPQTQAPQTQAPQTRAAAGPVAGPSAAAGGAPSGGRAGGAAQHVAQPDRGGWDGTGDPGPTEPPPGGDEMWETVEDWFNDPDTSTTAPPAKKRSQRRSASPTPGTPSGGGHNNTRQRQAGQKQPTTKQPGQKQGGRGGSQRAGSGQGPRRNQPDNKRGSQRAGQGAGGAHPRPAPAPGVSQADERLMRFVSAVRRDYPSGWDLVLRHSETAAVSADTLRVTVPDDKIDTARRAGFRDQVEAVAASCGFSSVDWKRRR